MAPDADPGTSPPDADHEAIYVFEYGTERRAQRIADAVDREVGEIDDDRSRARLDYTGTTVEIRVEAADLVALRAASNTWLGLVDTAERVTGIDHVDGDAL